MGTSEALKLKLHFKKYEFEIQHLNTWIDQVVTIILLCRIEFFAKSSFTTSIQGFFRYSLMKIELFLCIQKTLLSFPHPLRQTGRAVGGLLRSRSSVVVVAVLVQVLKVAKIVMKCSVLVRNASRLWVCFASKGLWKCSKRDPQQLFLARILRNETRIQQIQIF